MTYRGFRSLAVAGALACAAAPAGALGAWPGGGGGGGDVVEYTDAAGDARVRLTDPGADGIMGLDAALPDLLSLTASGWETDTPATNPYQGDPVRARDADLFRLDLVFAGLVNPPGPANALTYNPFLYGPSPVFGFLGIDVDTDRDTGGEMGGAATQRYLANVARFGGVPYGELSQRAARSGAGQDFDNQFDTEPYYERSGEDFVLALCGCYSSTVVSMADGDADGTFEAGETWVLRSRYFQRAGGYQGASGVFGGSAFGQYDPMVRIRFRHDAASDLTTITLIWGLDNSGAAQLAGTPEQDVDQLIDIGGNLASMEEALEDVIAGADGDNGGPLTGPTWELAHRWGGRDPVSSLDPTRWRFTALFGTAYPDEPASRYVWTDAGFDETFGDLNGDRAAGSLDSAEFDHALQQLDGSATDADGVVDGRYVIAGFGPNFSLYDLDSDGDVDADDRAMIEPGPPACAADWNGSGDLDSQDFFDFLDAFFEGEADFNGDSAVDSQDFFDFLDAFFQGCS